MKLVKRPKIRHGRVLLGRSMAKKRRRCHVGAVQAAVITGGVGLLDGILGNAQVAPCGVLGRVGHRWGWPVIAIVMAGALIGRLQFSSPLPFWFHFCAWLAAAYTAAIGAQRERGRVSWACWGLMHGRAWASGGHWRGARSYDGICAE